MRSLLLIVFTHTNINLFCGVVRQGYAQLLLSYPKPHTANQGGGGSRFFRREYYRLPSIQFSHIKNKVYTKGYTVNMPEIPGLYKILSTNY